MLDTLPSDEVQTFKMSETTAEDLEALRAENQLLKQKLSKKSEENFGIRDAAQKVLERDKEKNLEIARLVEECRQKEADVERLKTTLSYRDSVLSDLEENISELNRQLESNEAKHTAEISECQRNLVMLENKLGDKEAELSSAKEELARLKVDIVRKEAEWLACNSVSLSNENSLNETKTLPIESEHAFLKDQLAKMEEEKVSCTEKIESLGLVVNDLQKKLQFAEQAKIDLVDLCNDYELKAEEYKKRNDELNSELLEVRCSKTSKKGNSMFSEFVDERLKLEKDLLKLKLQNDALLSQKEVLDREVDNLRQELIFAFSRGTVETSSGSMLDLQKEIWALRSELDSLKHARSQVSDDCVERKVSNISRNTLNNDMFLQDACASMREEIKDLKRKLADAQRDRAMYFDKLSESENKRANELTKTRSLEMEVMNLERKLKKEEVRNNMLKLTKEEKEKMVERIVDAHSNIKINTSALMDSVISLPMTSRNSCNENTSGILAANNNTSRGSFSNKDCIQQAEASVNCSPTKRKLTPLCNESLPLEKRVKHVQFADEVLVNSVGSNSTLKVKQRRRNVRKSRSNVLDADANQENPECKQQ